jgi:hypothetical protein
MMDYVDVFSFVALPAIIPPFNAALKAEHGRGHCMYYFLPDAFLSAYSALSEQIYYTYKTKRQILL